MALNPNNLFTTATGLGSGLRFFPSSVQPKTFATGSGTLPKGTPLSVVTSSGEWVPWDAAGGAAGTEIMRGILWPDELALNGSDEVLGMVMLAGRFHIDDIDLSGTPGPESVANLLIELRATARANGYIVEGMPGFH